MSERLKRVPSGDYTRTDAGNAQRFAQAFKEHFRFVTTWDRFLHWDGARWRYDHASTEVMRAAKELARRLYATASREPNPDEGKKWADHAHRSQSKARLDATIMLAKSEHPFPVHHEQIESQAWLLNTLSGTVDLKSGIERRHRRTDLLMKITATALAKGGAAANTRWSRFLEHIFAGDSELIRFVQRLIGCALVGEQIDHVFAILHGSGANGKSVFIGAIQHALGDYAGVAAPDLFVQRPGDSHPTGLADLHGLRLVVLHETQAGATLNEGLVKAISGGDRIKARRMREDFWEFTPTHTAMLVTNHKPTIRGQDNGIWRRICLIPFAVTIPESEQDKDLPATLREEAPEILRWAIDGCIEWQQMGLNPPQAVRCATEDYRSESDVLADWLREACIADPSDHALNAGARELLVSCNRHLEASGSATLSQRKLHHLLDCRGFAKYRVSKGVRYRGISLTA